MSVGALSVVFHAGKVLRAILEDVVPADKSEHDRADSEDPPSNRPAEAEAAPMGASSGTPLGTNTGALARRLLV